MSFWTQEQPATHEASTGPSASDWHINKDCEMGVAGHRLTVKLLLMIQDVLLSKGLSPPMHLPLNLSLLKICIDYIKLTPFIFH